MYAIIENTIIENRHVKDLLTLDDYFIKISKTIGKKVSFVLDVSNNESSS
jgi:hypothetical protein